MSVSSISSVSAKDFEDPLILEYATKESKLITETAVFEIFNIKKSEKKSSVTPRRGFLNYLCDLHDKLTLRSTMVFLGLYVFLLCFQVIFQLDERLICRPAKPPSPFFYSNNSFVTDYYDGNGLSPVNLLRKTEVIVIMYYAPWSLESKYARDAYETVAKSLSSNSQVSFYAANCFSISGSCRKSYKIHAFPVIVAYFGKIPLVYNREIAADNLYSWISDLLKPMVRLTTFDEVKNFTLYHDFSVVAYFSVNLTLLNLLTVKEFYDFQLALKRYSRFQHYLSSSLHAVQHEDLLGKTGFAVLTDSETASIFGFTYDSQIHLYYQGYKEEFPHDFNYTGPHELGQLGKTEQFFSLLNKAPTLILLVKREPLYSEQSEVSIVSQTALEYFSCNGNISVEYYKRAVTRENQRRRRFSEISLDKNSCSMLSCCSSLEDTLQWLCSTCLSKNYLATLRQPKNTCYRYNQIPNYNNLFRPLNAECEFLFSHGRAESALKECCHILNTVRQNSGKGNAYYASCNKFKLAKRFGYNSKRLFEVDESFPFDKNSIIGLSCKQNHTLRFAAVDTQNNNFWLRRWSLPNRKAQVVIADFKREAVYLMKDEFSRLLTGADKSLTSLRRMIRQFHSQKLQPHYHTEEDSIRADSGNSRMKLVRKTTATRFSQDVLDMQSESDVVVLFSGGEWHGPSSSIFYVYHNVALYFKQFSNALQFFMIDVSKNDLPWPFKMDLVPAVIFFPAHRIFRKSSSFNFPSTVPFTVPNLVSFVIAHCSTELRWRIALSSCSYLCLFRNKLCTRRRLRSISADIIDLQNLKKNYTDVLHTQLIESSIHRRRNQFQVLRNLLFVLNSLNKLSMKQIHGEAVHISEMFETLQSSTGFSNSDYATYDIS
uniref:Thioredoxin domain-containing protein 11 n=1 Tax=Syphacia muris TaxID=451379 RepID=A0A0N5AQV7_9BILA